MCRHLLAGAILAEDIPAVPAVVLPVGEAEGLAAAGAGHHLGVVLPLPPRLLHQLHLHIIALCGFDLLFAHQVTKIFWLKGCVECSHLY